VAEVQSRPPKDSVDSVVSLFNSTLIKFLQGSKELEETAKKFLETNHEYVNYIAMALYSTMIEQSLGDQAKKLLEKRWSEFRVDSWQQRLRAGDPMVWREMLVGYYLGKLPRAAIFESLEDEEAYAHSDLRFIPMTRLGMLCEAIFYDALLSKKDGAGFRKKLEKVMATGQRRYHEYEMAKVLLMWPDAENAVLASSGRK
jgi:hypothetical protein